MNLLAYKLDLGGNSSYVSCHFPLIENRHLVTFSQEKSHNLSLCCSVPYGSTTLYYCTWRVRPLVPFALYKSLICCDLDMKYSHVIFFSCLIASASASDTVLIRSRHSGEPCLISDFSEMTASFSLFRIILDVCYL